MNKMFKIVLMVCAIVLVLAISGSMIYYFAFFIPGNEKAKWEAEIELKQEQLEWEKEKQEKEEQQKKNKEIKLEQEKFEKETQEALKQQGLADCLDGAYQNYKERMDECFKTYVRAWDTACEIIGRNPDCTLPEKTADSLDKDYQREVDRTEKAYDDDKADCFKLYGSD